MSTLATTGCVTKSSNVRDVPSTTEIQLPRLSADESVRKRKHGQLDESPEIWQPFSIQSAQPTSESQHQSLIPKLLLPRSHLPLAYLDLAADEEPLPGSRLFAATISLLEANNDGLQPSQPTVLVAQDESSGRFYAIEEVHNGVYALCRLGRWVTEDALRKLTDDHCLHIAPSQCTARDELDPPPKEWWRLAAVPSHITSYVPISSEKAITRARKFKLSLKRPLKEKLSPVRICSINTELKLPQKDIFGATEVIDEGLQKPGDVLKKIRTHYLEALYLSRTSLAYFAKGPLSRARASFQPQDSSASNPYELAQYLRTMILTLPVMDKKYRDTIPNIVKQYPFSSLSEGECTLMIESVRKKSRRFRHDKINKDGLIAGEDVNIAHWWLGRDMQCVSGETDEARKESLKTTIQGQRAREAQLQIIVLLEILALEANAVDLDEKVSRTDNTGFEHDNTTSKTKNPKKPQDLNILLDLLADRLCIWHSMNAEPDKPSANQHQQSGSQRNPENRNNDHLRQFCVDVILPFYGARLPEVSALLCQKLGGSKDPSPKRPPPTSLKAISKVSIKPGAPIPRSELRKPRRTLERVLTDDKSRHKRQATILARSATEPVLQVKREVRDISLSLISLKKAPMSKRYTQREVDLRAASHATELKHKKKMSVEKELQGAIAAIKRPDPRMAGREFVETVERRQAGSRSRKPRNPIHNLSGQCLQVMATPSKNKHAVPYKLPSLPQAPHSKTCEADDLPPFSVSRVILSSTKKVAAPNASSDNYNGSSSVQTNVTHINQTPTRSSARFINSFSCLTKEENADTGSSPPGLLNAFLKPPDEPCKPTTGKSNMQETPSKRPDLEWQISHLLTSDLQVTPCKQPLPQAPRVETPSPSSHLEVSDLYASLGWDYEVDD